MKRMLFLTGNYFRRVVIALCIAFSFLSLLLFTQIALESFFGSPSLYAQSNPIVAENNKPGSTEWALTNPANDTNLAIKGYASATSVNIGETIDIYVTITSTTAMTYTVDLYRMGYYNGDGGRRVMPTVGPLNGIEQPPVTVDLDPNHATGLVEANWTQPLNLAIDCSWTTGVYLAKLENADGKQNYVKFVVRNDGIPGDGLCETEDHVGDFLYQHADTTDQAYNRFPVDGATGKSLYSGWGGNTVAGNQQAVKVSFNRPYEKNGAGNFFKWEYPLIRWLEKRGYDLNYISDLDTHQSGVGANNFLRNYKAVFSTGHDEYFSRAMYDSFTDARDSGVHLAFWGANAVYWQVRFEDNDRTMVSYKNASIDPETDPTAKSIKFRDVGLPEQELVGVQYITYNTAPGPDDSIHTDYVVKNSDHWVYSFTGFADDDTATKLVGYEVDKDFGNLPPALPNSYVLLSASPFTGINNSGPVPTTANSSIYQAASGAWVFATGTMGWVFALDDSSTEMSGSYLDDRIERTTINVLETFLSNSTPGSCGGLAQEAEDGYGAADFEIAYDVNASGGEYIYVPTGVTTTVPNPHYAEYCMTVSQAGLYTLKGQVYAPTPAAVHDSFFVQVNDLPAAGQTWHLTTYDTYFESTVPTEWVLAEGDHTVRIYLRESMARLDTIRLELETPAPAAATLVAPTGNTSTPAPIFEWIGDSLATSYRLVIYNATLGTVEHDITNITDAAATCIGGGACTYDPAVVLTTGHAYTWLVESYGVGGASPWSTYP